MSNPGNFNVIDHDEDEDLPPTQYRHIVVELHRKSRSLPDKPGATRIFWERHPAHPGGEVTVSGDQVVEVAETDAVRDAIRAEVLREVTGRKQPTPERPQMADLLDQGKIGRVGEQPSGAEVIATAIAQAVEAVVDAKTNAAASDDGETSDDAEGATDVANASPKKSRRGSAQ